MEQLIDINDNNNNNNDCTVREQDRFMPIANVIRIMRKILPPHAKISDNAKETIQECVSEYISFITSEANDRCQREQRKTITAEDVLWAMRKLGFDDYIEPLTFYINRYRDLEGGDRGSIRAKPLMNRAPMDPDPNGLFNGPMGGFQYHPHHQHQHPSVDADASIGNGFQYYPQHQHQHLGGAGAGTSTANGFYPHMVGYVKKATSSQAMGGIEHHGQYGQGRNN